MDRILEGLMYKTIAEQSFMYKDIEELYLSNELEFLISFKNSNLNNNPFFKLLSHKEEKYTKMVAGIFTFSLSKNDFDYIDYLMKKRFKKINNKIKNSNHKYLAEALNDIYTINDNLMEVATYIYCKELISGAFERVSTKENLSLYETSMNLTETNFRDLIDYEITRTNALVNTVSISTIFDYVDVKNTDVNNLKNKVGIKNNSNTLNCLISDILTNEMELTGKTLEEVQHTGSISKYLSLFAGLLNSFNMPTETFFKNSEISKKECFELLKYDLSILELKKMDSKELNWIIPISLYTFSLIKEYKAIREDFSKVDDSKYMYELYELKNKYNDLQNEVDDLKNQLKIEKDRSLDLLKQIEAARTALNKTETINSKLEEVVESKNFQIKLVKLASTSLLKKIDEQVTIDEAINTINNSNTVIIGGDVSWVNKLKNKLTVKFIGASDINKDLKFLTGYENILINIALPHSLIFKISQIVGSKNFKYISQTTNLDLSIETIFKNIKKAP